MSKWRLWDFVTVFFAGIGGSIVATVVVVGVGADPLDPLPFSLVFLTQAAASFWVVVVLSRRRGSGSLAADVGLIVRPGHWWGVVVGMGLQVAISLITAPFILWMFPDGPPQQGVSEIAGQSDTVVDQLAVFVAIAVVAPIIEEIIFRGILLSVLDRVMAKWPAILVSAAVFASVHLLDPNAIAVIPGLFLVGIALAWAALRTGDLSLPIALHSGINLLAAISILYGTELLNWSEQQLQQMQGIIRFVWFF